MKRKVWILGSAAEAARTSAYIIEGSANEIQNGLSLVKESNSNFASLNESSRQMASLLDSIAMASSEQHSRSSKRKASFKERAGFPQTRRANVSA